MSFVHPGWLALLLVLPFILLGAILTDRGRSRAWQRLVAPRLRSQLVKQESSLKRWLSIGLAMFGSALLILVIARPYSGETITTEEIRTRNILLAIDTSRSMLVRDGSPDRMATAKAIALELLEEFPNDRVGVIAFSGASVLMAPLTIDHTAVHETISQLDTDVIPSGGSNLPAAVTLAIETFEKTNQKANALVLISDGEDHSDQTDLAAAAIRESETTVCAIGVGSKNGGIIPDYQRPDQKFRDISGQTVLSQLNDGALDTLARAGKGSYYPASSGVGGSIASTLKSLKQNEQQGRTTTIPNETYQWFLFPGVLLLILSMLVRSRLFRAPPRMVKNTATLALLSVLCLTSQTSVHAAALERGKQAYERRDYQDALKLFQHALNEVDDDDLPAVQFAIGSSAYRLRKWEQSNKAFSMALLSNDPALQENSHYNLAQSLFRSGLQTLRSELAGEMGFFQILNSIFGQMFDSAQATDKEQKTISKEDLNKVITSWEDAISHYQAAIDLNPKNIRAKSNQKNVQRLLDLLKQGQNGTEQDQGEDTSSEQSQDSGDDQQKSDQQGDGQGDNPDQDPKDPSGKGNQDSPDDPKNNDGPENKNPEQPENQPEQNQLERKEGESDEAYAARILKENADAETRPVQRRLLHLRRPAKDW
ncbi:VWA domain-containing protein [Verrucomicrobiaceae bacterium N1E253]|uniref:VWA domain-containing protein n=1 Tax=Oceaniferula marina TaxID=2748318 RepID=A0A851GKE7_9BACT|nr:VWA domain-containing protein [Oceaniferula marina]NWK57619.1 VWA domain-containing protein [Oceaniferula marina]